MDSQHKCELCGALENLKLCAGCQNCYYCCKEHQRSHWKQHKPECKKCQSRVKPKLAGSAPGHKNSDDMSSVGVEQPSEMSRTQVGGCPAHEKNVQTPDINIGVREQGYSTVDHAMAYHYGHMDENIIADNSLHSASHVSDIGFSSDLDLSGFMDITEGVHATDSVVYDASDFTRPGLCQEMAGIAIPKDQPISQPIVKQAGSENNNNSGTVSEHPSYKTNGEGVYGLSRPSVDSHVRGKRKVKNSYREQAVSELTPTRSMVPPSETSLADYVVKCLVDYGLCVVDDFMGEQKGDRIISEVCHLQGTEGAFQDGQTTLNRGQMQQVRGDQISWVGKNEPGLESIGLLIERIDTLMVVCTRKLQAVHINSRTKAMVACYPGGGRGYMRHVDNPNGDGRIVTCIYYLNKNWDIQKDGGLLRIFPTKFKTVADIVPKFDRVLFFWSDRRNPHEVQPAYRSRLAITVWYFDTEERKRARIRHNVKGTLNKNLQ